MITTAAEASREVGNKGHGSIYVEKVVPPYPVSNSLRILHSVVSSSTSE